MIRRKDSTDTATATGTADIIRRMISNGWGAMRTCAGNFSMPSRYIKKLAIAVTYAKNQRASLENYFKDGRLELSDSSAERKVKSYVMGRKNFLFHNSVDGAKASAVVYSIVETAKENSLNIFQYLQTLLFHMPDYKNEPEIPSHTQMQFPKSDSALLRASRAHNAATFGTPVSLTRHFVPHVGACQ